MATLETSILGKLGFHTKWLSLTGCAEWKDIKDLPDLKLVSVKIVMDNRNSKDVKGMIRLLAAEEKSSIVTVLTPDQIKKDPSHKFWTLIENPYSAVFTIPEKWSDALNTIDDKDTPLVTVVVEVDRRPADVDDTTKIMHLSAEWLLSSSQ